MASTFASLGVRNYRMYFFGILLSNIGGWMGRTAISWLVLVELTHGSASALGLVTAIEFIPVLLLMPFAGTVADRFAKYKVLGLTQIVLVIDSCVLAVCTITGITQLWMVYLIAFIDGISFAFDNPARQSFVSEIVSKRYLANAIGLNSASFNTARLIGPGVAGVLIAMLGTGWVIAINTASYLGTIIALIIMRKDELHPAPIARGRGKTIEGFRYALKRPDLLVFLACGLAVGGLAFNFAISNAVMATEHFGKGAGEYGILGSAMGVGALAAALWAATRKKARLRYSLLGMVGYVVFGILAAYSPSFELFAVLQIPIGLASITVLVTSNTMLQSSTTAIMRGRIMALWSLAIMGVTPLISPLVGWLGDVLGPRATVLFGVVCVGVALAIIMTAVMKADGLRLRFDRHAPGFVRLVRPGEVTETLDAQ